MQGSADEPRPRWSGRLMKLAEGLLLVVTLSLAFGIGAWISLRFSVRRSPEVRVPNLVGMGADQAQEAVRAAGLAPEIAGRRFDPRQAEGKVLAQMPNAGSNTRPGRPVRLIVSLGERHATIPDLVGSSDGRAQTALRSMGLVPGTVVRVPDATVGAGRILGQHPPAGVEGGPGDKVDLLMSAGRSAPVFVMPNLVGRPLGPTLAALARHGFQRARGQGGGDNSAITGQDPAPGYPVSVADPVLLTAGP